MLHMSEIVETIPWLAPVARRMLSHRIGFVMAEPGPVAFWPPPMPGQPTVVPGQPAVAMVLDVEPDGPGPEGFHGPSLTGLLRDATTVVVSTAEYSLSLYQSLADDAALRGHIVVIIETTPDRQGRWIAAAARGDVIVRGERGIQLRVEVLGEDAGFLAELAADEEAAIRAELDAEEELGPRDLRDEEDDDVDDAFWEALEKDD